MNTMHTLRTTLLVALMGLGVTGATLAQTPAATATPAPGRHAHAADAQERHARMGERFAKHQAKLHDALKLTSAQEAAWTTYQTAIRPTPHAGAQGTPGTRAEWATLSAPARMEKVIAMAKEHVAKMEAHLAALNTFYGVLTTEQKKTFDAASKRGGWGGRHGRGHGGHGQHGEHHGEHRGQANAKPA